MNIYYFMLSSERSYECKGRSELMVDSCYLLNSPHIL